MRGWGEPGKVSQEPELRRIGRPDRAARRRILLVGLEANRAPIVIARLQADESVWNFKLNVMEMVRSIEQQYWILARKHIQLWSSEKAVDLARRMEKAGVKTQPLSHDVVRDDERCTHCGACVTVCPVGALVLNASTRKVDFYKDKCIACELCVKACPPRAMEIKF